MITSYFRTAVVKENISNEIISFCLTNNLNDIESVLNYINNYFKSPDDERFDKSMLPQLLDICKLYFNQPIIYGLHIDLSIELLCQFENISLRTLNICFDNELFSIKDILKFRRQNRGFDKLRRCGSKSNHELISICIKYEKYFIDVFESEEVNEKIQKQELEDNRFIADDVELYSIARAENLSRQSILLCEYAGLTTLSKILKYYHTNHSFKKLWNACSKTNIELVKLCVKYNYLTIKSAENVEHLPISKVVHIEDVKSENRSDSDQSSLENNILLYDTDLYTLAHLENLSQRSINVCQKAGLLTLGQIIGFKNIYYDFFKLRNCGSKTNGELNLLCKKYGSNIENDSNEIPFQFPESQAFKTIVIDENYDLETIASIEKISIRSYNICKEAGLHSLRLIIQYFYNNRTNGFLGLANCGNSSNQELTALCHKYEKNVTGIHSGEDKGIDTFSPIDQFLGHLRVDVNLFRLIKKSISVQKDIPLFKLIDLLIDHNQLFKNDRQTQIFKSTFNLYYPLKDYSLEEIGERFELTKERVRQIREQVFSALPRVVSNLFNYNDCIFKSYISNVPKNIILISESDAQSINVNEGTQFTPLFISYILSFQLKKDFVRFGDLKTLFSNKIFSKKLINKQLYLIHRTLIDKFKFEKFYNYLNWLICQKRSIDEHYSYIDLVNKFKKTTLVDYSCISETIKTIVEGDFTAVIHTSEEGITLIKNAKKSITSYIVEVLDNSYKPLHYSEIFQQLINAGVKIASEQSVHQVLVRENNIFGLKGFGIYDLRRKGGFFGTIGDVAEQILIHRNAGIELQELENLICNELVVSKDSISVVLFNYNNENRFYRDRSGYVKLKKWLKT